MSNLFEIQGQIEKLQKQANEIKAREFDKTVQEIRVKMIAFGITFKDIQTGKTSNTKAKRKSVATSESIVSKVKSRGNKSSMAVAAKYRGLDGETWSGRGLTPRWLAALVKQGRAKEEFIIQS